jgi:Na+(H+)/acetate symporter ActP
VRRDWAALESPVFRPIIMCGQHSLEIFCLGEFLSLGGYFVNVELSAGFATQLAVSVSGILIMIATAAMLDWYKNIEGRSRGTRPPSRKADLAEG